MLWYWYLEGPTNSKLNSNHTRRFHFFTVAYLSLKTTWLERNKIKKIGRKSGYTSCYRWALRKNHSPFNFSKNIECVSLILTLSSKTKVFPCVQHNPDTITAITRTIPWHVAFPSILKRAPHVSWNCMFSVADLNGRQWLYLAVSTTEKLALVTNKYFPSFIVFPILKIYVYIIQKKCYFIETVINKYSNI